jgi:chorismate-pyruvate lyase
MSQAGDPAAPDVQSLFALFPPAEYLGGYEAVSAEEVPQPYHRLLVHEHHMTVTVEAHHGSLVDVKVLQEHQSGDAYARKILLALKGTGRVVQFGLMRVRFKYCDDKVRREILAKKTPLGRILIQNNVLRRIEPTAFWRVTPGPKMVEWFGLDRPQPTYGRLALIHCNHQPAVELLEIVAPE